MGWWNYVPKPNTTLQYGKIAFVRGLPGSNTDDVLAGRVQSIVVSSAGTVGTTILVVYLPIPLSMRVICASVSTHSLRLRSHTPHHL